MCIYVLLHEPEFNTTVSSLITVVYARVCHDLADLNFSFFCEVLLKFRKCYHPYDNFGKKNDNFI